MTGYTWADLWRDVVDLDPERAWMVLFRDHPCRSPEGLANCPPAVARHTVLTLCNHEHRVVMWVCDWVRDRLVEWHAVTGRWAPTDPIGCATCFVQDARPPGTASWRLVPDTLIDHDPPHRR
jgi:hypothetical protein